MESENRACPRLFVVIPCYNEQEVLPETSKRILEKLGRMISAGLVDPKSRVLFVDDGSKDATWSLISGYCRQDPHFAGLKLSHNRGQQTAFLAGMMQVRPYADCVITMDADLQDDIEVMDQFIEKYREGAEVVYGVRHERTTDTAFKRQSALAFYRFQKNIGIENVNNHADYRLMGRKVLDALSEYEEGNLYIRGIVPQIGYPSDTVYYDRAERFAGETKYPLKKMISFAIDGITSFSTWPLAFVTRLGIFVGVISVLALIYALLAAIFRWPLAGVFGLMGGIYLLGAILLVCLGVTGIYIGKIYQESKHRPRYFAEEFLLKDQNHEL